MPTPPRAAPLEHDPAIPWWALVVPALALGALALPVGAGGLVTIVAALVLAGAVFAAVHHAEAIAEAVGEPFGTLILAVAVTVIEVSLILTLMIRDAASTDPAEVAQSATLARDTIVAALMIVLNGIVGLCLLVGGTRHHEQRFTRYGVSATLAMIATLATLVLILPNYTVAEAGPVYSTKQLAFVGVASLALYGVFVVGQTLRHRDYFILAADVPRPAPGSGDRAPHHPPLRPLNLIALMAALFGVVFLAKNLSDPITDLIVGVGLPLASVGIVIAGLVLLPEGIAAASAARANQIQRSLNLALGSALATIGLTIPAIAVAATILDLRLVLGLEPTAMVLLALTLLVSTLSLGTGRTTILQGAVHLVIFAAYLFTVAVP